MAPDHQDDGTDRPTPLDAAEWMCAKAGTSVAGVIGELRGMHVTLCGGEHERTSNNFQCAMRPGNLACLHPLYAARPAGDSYTGHGESAGTTLLRYLKIARNAAALGGDAALAADLAALEEGPDRMEHFMETETKQLDRRAAEAHGRLNLRMAIAEIAPDQMLLAARMRRFRDRLLAAFEGFARERA